MAGTPSSPYTLTSMTATRRDLKPRTPRQRSRAHRDMSDNPRRSSWCAPVRGAGCRWRWGWR